MTTAVELGLFTPSVVLDVTRRLGILDAAGIDVREHLVVSSPAQMQALADGDLDLAITSPDNVLLYAGFDDNPRGRRLPLTITAALDRGLGLSLWTRPGTTLAEARVFGVDVPVSGFALAAFALLARHGVDRDRLEVVSLGSTPRRRAALVAGDCDVTILGAGNDLRAEEDGCHRVATVDELGDYVGAVTCRLQTADPTRAHAADAVAAALVRVGGEIADGRLGEMVVESAQHILGLSDAGARRHLAILRSATTGIVRRGHLARGPIDTLVALRAARHGAAELAEAAEHLLAATSGAATAPSR